MKKEFHMSVTITSTSGNELSVSFTVALNGSMFEMEQAIEAAINEAGSLVTGKALERFDADGDPIQLGPVKLTSKGRVRQKYQSPFGSVALERHLYQTQDGGSTFCPLEHDARIILTATPKFAKGISFKYAESGSRRVARDYSENHGRTLSSRYSKSVADAVGSLAEEKVETWSYAIPEMPEDVASIGVSLDGTCLLMLDDGWRETMVGCFSLYDKMGNRMHTIYLGATPEYGKTIFKQKFDAELTKLREIFPDVPYVAVADGATSNWTYLTSRTDEQVLDFYHATEYVGNAANILHKRKTNAPQKEMWLSDHLHKLKHTNRHIGKLIKELEERRGDIRAVSDGKTMDGIITYLKNNRKRMNYAEYRGKHFPIGSGVCEAACKTLIKQRLGGSGMRWKEEGAQSVINLRALQQTPSRWDQFWSKINQYGFQS